MKFVRLFLLSLFCLFTTAAGSHDQDKAVTAAKMFAEKNQRLEAFAEDSDKALDAMVKIAARELRRRGYGDDAEVMEGEFTDRFKGSLAASFKFSALGLGDHRPLSRWLAEQYDKLEDRLGPQVMRMTRLSDLKTFNFAIPVVFNPTGDPYESPVVEWGADEYRLHFVPFAGAVGFWTSWLGCSAASWGAGAVTYACSYVGWAVEWIIMKRVAPKWSDKIYQKYND